MRDVVLGYCHNGNVRQEWHASVSAHGWYDKANNNHLAGELAAGGPYIPDNRCRVIARFLDQTSCEWLWFTDVDVVFPPFILDQLLEAADPKTRPVMAALYFTKLDADGGNLWLPTWMEDGEEFGEYSWVRQLQIGEVRELTMVAWGCTIIHRSVLEGIREVYAPIDPWPWSGHDIVNDPVMGPNRIGDDVTFCRRARDCGFSVWGLTEPVIHMKTAKVGWKEFIQQRDIEAFKRESGEAYPGRNHDMRVDVDPDPDDPPPAPLIADPALMTELIRP